MKALLIVDVQNDFCPGGALPAPEGDKVIPVINNIIDRFDLVIASKDWHPDDSIHFVKWPVHCVRNTKGSEFHPDLDHTKIKKVFLKGTGNKDDGYSAFEATNENLEKYLKENQTDELYISGIATEYCVKESALDAVNKGFKTYVIKDAVQGVRVKEDDERKAIDEMKKAGVKIIITSDI